MPAMDSVYDLYQRGCALLDHGDHQAAIVPLSKARDLEPDKASIREALGRALFHAQRYEGAAEEFQAVAARTPTNDYALFCLGLQAARAGVLAGTRAGRLPALPRTCEARRRARLSPPRGRAPLLSSNLELSYRRAGAGSRTESGRPPAFFA